MPFEQTLQNIDAASLVKWFQIALKFNKHPHRSAAQPPRIYALGMKSDDVLI